MTKPNVNSPQSAQENPEITPEQALKTNLFAYIILLDPFFGDPIPDHLAKRSAGGSVSYFLSAVEDGRKILENAGEHTSTKKLTALLWEEYNIARQSYSVENSSPTAVSDLPSNPFTERIIGAILENERAKEQA